MAPEYSSRKLSRRLFGLLTAAPLATAAPSQDPARPSPAAPVQPRQASPAVARFDVPMSTEPGFIFKP